MRLSAVAACLLGLLTVFQPATAQAELVTFRYESTTLVNGATTHVVVVFTSELQVKLIDGEVYTARFTLRK